MGRKWIQALPVIVLAALLMTGCSFRRNDTSSDGGSSTGAGPVSSYPASSYAESDWGDTYSSVLSDGNSLASAIQSEMHPDRNESASSTSAR
ncbi:MAG: hypothetical protein IJY28_03375 [Clostridia bacterium]|nr:hypothetical protein [Clostridia bacterium]